MGFKHWFYRSGEKVLVGILIGAGILFMMWASFLHKSNIGFVLGIAFVMTGILTVLLVFLTEKSDRRSNHQNGKDRKGWPHW